MARRRTVVCVHGWGGAASQFRSLVSHDSRDGVDAVVEAAAAAGGKADVRERMDMGWLYNRAVEDRDGHILELVWMDMDATANAQGEHA